MDDLLGAPLQAKLALAALLAALCVSVVTDLRQKLILDVVTLPALAIVAACAASLGGWALLAEAAAGALVCAGPFALAALRGWMGAGDVKLMAVAGAVSGIAAGWPFSVQLLLCVAIAGGAQALAGIVAARLRGREIPRQVPYGVAIAVGTVAAFVWG